MSQQNTGYWADRELHDKVITNPHHQFENKSHSQHQFVPKQKGHPSNSEKEQQVRLCIEYMK